MKILIWSIVIIPFLANVVKGQQEFPWNDEGEQQLSQLLGGTTILDVMSNSQIHKRFARSNRKNDDTPNSSSSSDDDESHQEKIENDDNETTMIINEICSPLEESKPNSSSGTNNFNQTRQSYSSTTKEKLLCQLLKKMSRSLKKTGAAASGSDQYLPENYNKYEAPKLKYSRVLRNKTVIRYEKPVEVQVFLNVRSIVDFDDDDGLVTLDMDVIMLWTDGTILKANQDNNSGDDDDVAVVLSPTFLKKLWTPDIYIEEVMSLSQPTFMGNSITVVLHPKTGVVIYRSRVLAKLNCQLIFKHYPADTQICTFTLKSFSYTTERLTLNWILQGGTGVYLHGISDPNFDYQINSFTSNDTYLDIGPASDPSTLYSSLQFTLMARRKMTYQLVQTYFASVFFVIVTWLCFLISPDMFEVRVGIAMSTLLTLTAMFASVRDGTPKVSYVKAIDIWMVVSIIFIFVALAGFTLTAWIKRGLVRMQGPKDDDEPNLDILEYKKRKVMSEAQTKKIMKKYRLATMCIERFGVYILSLAYVLYNVIYWTWLMQSSNYLRWSINSTFNNMDA